MKSFKRFKLDLKDPKIVDHLAKKAAGRPRPKHTNKTDDLIERMMDAARHLEFFEQPVTHQEAQTVVDSLDHDPRVQHLSSGGGDVTYSMEVKKQEVLLNVSVRAPYSVTVSPQEPDEDVTVN